jgi:hypothetical protein
VRAVFKFLTPSSDTAGKVTLGTESGHLHSDVFEAAVVARPQKELSPCSLPQARRFARRCASAPQLPPLQFWGREFKPGFSFSK